MFNRSTKLTALLVAAASVMSTVPAMAATKLANKEGTVENAVAFKDGKYLYEGYRTDDDDKGLYFNEGDKDKPLDDADSLVENSKDSVLKFGDKYVQAWDGNDEYIIDLSSGKVTDDDTISDSKETAATKLKNKLKKTDRYDGIEDSKFGEDNLTLLDSNKFADEWYEYKTTITTGSGADAHEMEVVGYTNASGTYIDASYDMNLYVFNGDKMVKLEDIEDKANGKDAEKNKDAVKIKDVEHLVTLGQDDKYIYRLIKVTVDNAYQVGTADKENKLLSETKDSSSYYVQRVSKAQGDKKDDAYLPKSTDCYQVGQNKATLNNDDARKAYDFLMDYKAYKEDSEKNPRYELSIVDGAFYVVYSDDEKVKVDKLVFKTSEKLKVENSNNDKVDGHILKHDDDTDTKADDWTIDTNGTVWAIYNGEIKKSAKLASFDTVYTCDRSLDRLDVYDENNLIAWDHNGDVYTNVTEGAKQAKDEAEQLVGPAVPATPAKTGWDQLADGTWNLYDVTGAKVTGWANVGGVWYFMDANGTMKTGWVQDGSTWYFLNASGAMQTGWVQDGSTWYYCNASGAMQTGWVQVNGTWYFLKSSGAMAANETVDGYYVNASGAWVR